MQMTCGYENCTTVCPGECSQTMSFGNTLEVVDEAVMPATAYTITFEYLTVTFALVITALCADGIIQLLIGAHMLYTWLQPGQGNWYFFRNLHQRSLFVTMVYFLRPGLLYNALFHPSVEIYPTLPEVPKVPLHVHDALPFVY